MNDNNDFQNLINDSFGDGPTTRPLEDRLTAGRRTVRRRRLTTSFASLAAAAVIGGAAYAAIPSGNGSGDGTTPATPAPATSGGATPTEGVELKRECTVTVAELQEVGADRQGDTASSPRSRQEQLDKTLEELRMLHPEWPDECRFLGRLRTK